LALIFVFITGITIGCLIFYLLDISFLNDQAKKALSPMALIPPDRSILKTGVVVHDGENNIPTAALKNNQVIFHGPVDKKQIALTFDADMTPGMIELLHSGRVKSYYDKKIVDILIQTKTKATVFLTGMWIEQYPDITSQLAANSLFELGNHSYSHPSFYGYCYGLRQIPKSQEEEEIRRTQQLLQISTGGDNKLFRFPGGCYSPKEEEQVEKNGLAVIQWDVAGQDGFNNNGLAIENNVLTHVKNGSIIVLHFNGYPNEPKTAEVLPEIISQLKIRGFEFVTVSDLIKKDTNASGSAYNLKQHLPFISKLL
jgi:peptidoglycan/xylan/chitin deacetylase (PgdA/CDA1 family)